MKEAQTLLLLIFLTSFVSAGTLETLSLPAPSPGGSVYYSDVQASFPGTDWSTLDRLYLPAGHWDGLWLGNLPERTAESPLVITNIGGQSKFGGLGGAQHPVVLLGGSHWQLTGRWDALEATGNEASLGHAGGYANSSGTYGVFIDDNFEDSGVSGLVIGGGASDFEVSFVEITRVGFAGAVFKTDDQGDAHMNRVRFHDNYVHDTGSEGLYFGSTQSPPQHKFPALEVYNNRILRTGTEIAQLGQLGSDSEIHHNVFLLGALDWKNPFSAFQDNGSQFAVREGDVSFHHNILIGGGTSFFQFFPQPIAGDTHAPGDSVTFSDNYLSHSRNFGVYLHAQSDSVTEIRFQENWFREINYHYDEIDPGGQDRNAVVVTFNTESPMVFLDNSWSGPQSFMVPVGSNVTETGSNHLAEIAPVVFMDSGFPADFDYSRVEMWTDVDFNGVAVHYQPGDYVTDSGSEGGGSLYLCLQANTNAPPATSPGSWALQPSPVDDLRLHPSSPFQGFGLLDTAGSIFFDGFESGTTGAW